MNLIVNRQLDRAQKQVIYELTLKKRQSKKSTMSEKQVLARQQLAEELMQERKFPTTNHNHINGHQNQITTTNSSCSSCSSCSFSRSDSSYSGSSQDSGAQMMIAEREDLSQEERNEILGRKKEANIKFNKNRLEHLNSELDKRLQQYEYLVAQEKALLRTYNMMLFTNEGVNNFHLHDALINPNSRRQHQKQLQQNKVNALKNSNGFINSNVNIAASNLNLTTPTSSKSDTVPEMKKTGSTSSSRPQLNSSASTVSNLNNIHVLPPVFAGPRRSASSVALITITQR